MSIKKIADMVGASPATVSRVLNNPEYRCKDTQLRNKIWDAAMEINYVPNEAAKSLRSGKKMNNNRTYYINVLLTRTEDARSDPFYSELLRIIETEVHRSQNILNKVWYVSAFSNERKSRMTDIDSMIDELYRVTECKSDGLIIIGKCYDKVLTKLKKVFKNVVSVNRNSTNHLVDEVTCDGRKIATKAVEYLFSLGHNEIGYVGECQNETRYKGYVDTMIRHDMEPIPRFIYETNQTEADGYAIMQKILKSKDIPTGIYCANDITAIGMLKAYAKRKNKFVNISIVSSDDIEQAQFSTPMLTTVSLPKNEMGRFAVEILIDRIAGRHNTVITMELDTKLVVRDSCSDISDSGWGYYI